MSKRVFVTGGTGFIGSALVDALRGRGDEVVVLSRDAARARRKLGHGVEVVEGDAALGGAWQERLRGADAVVNLAGAPVAGQRWDARYKQRIRDSRVEGTRYVAEGMAAIEAEARPGVLVSASGADYYPFDVDLEAADIMDEDDAVTESAPPGDSFLARVCRSWEAEAMAAEEHGARVVCMRTGLVLGRDGAFSRMALPFRLFAGGPIGSGRQWMAWVHLEDAVRAYLFALDQEGLRGPVNLVAPGPVRARDFARALGKALHRPSWLPVPGLAVKVAAGELSEYLLHGRRVVPTALEAHGFTFHFPAVEPALADVARDG